MEENKEYLIPTSKDEDHIFSNIDLTFGRQSNEFDIKIIGVGTAGCNIVDYLAQTNKSINE
ncbi:MAG: hypothetical protein MJ223_02475 [Mycoplasmoidaceae bacterium]|nr:hypothetical protein [Mycoplasmoidaceae bacterium]